MTEALQGERRLILLLTRISLSKIVHMNCMLNTSRLLQAVLSELSLYNLYIQLLKKMFPLKFYN